MLKNNKNLCKAFTIVEVMISLAILALISGATVLVAQPNIIKDQISDQRRVNELDDINEAITYLNT
jgi:prepilin-type N-terminal cleavage/methylation domain-containing protein